MDDLAVKMEKTHAGALPVAWQGGRRQWASAVTVCDSRRKGARCRRKSYPLFIRLSNFFVEKLS